MTPLLFLLACTDDVTGTDSGSTPDSGTTDSAPAPTHLLITTVDGIERRTLDGDLETLWAWSDLTDACDAGCNPEGVQVDGDGLLVAYSASMSSGGILRLKAENGDLVRDWELQDYGFPHDAITDPSGLGVIVAETFAGRLLWLDPSDETVLATLDDSHSSWDYSLPNSLELIEHTGQSYLLMSNRGNDLSGGSGSAVDGSLVLWDITDPTNPAQVWHYPESGTVGMPHSPVMKRVSGTWVLAYAHTIGVSYAGNEVHSSVGLAISDDLTAQPTYVADGVLPTALGDIETSRGVDLGTDGRLYVVETGSRGGDGRLLTATLPELTPAGSSGAYSESHADQIFVTLDDAAVLADDLGGAFEPRLWTPSY
jgi:hypothetical protein